MVDKAFKEIDDLFEKLGEKNKEALENAKIKPIHEKYLYSQNGIIAMIAGMGSGKTYRCLKMTSQQEVLFDEPFFETIALCSTSGEFDETTKTFREGIRKSNLILVKDTNLLSWLNEYTAKSFLHKTLSRFVKNGLKNPCDEMKKIIENNRLNTKVKLIEYISKTLNYIGWETNPHRLLLILEDFASHPLLKKRDDPLSRMLKKLRHFNITVIIIVQTVKSIPKDLKRNLSDLILFPGISEEDFLYLIRESSASCFPLREVWEEYRKIKEDHIMFSLHIKAKEYKTY